MQDGMRARFRSLANCIAMRAYASPNPCGYRACWSGARPSLLGNSTCSWESSHRTLRESKTELLASNDMIWRLRPPYMQPWMSTKWQEGSNGDMYGSSHSQLFLGFSIVTVWPSAIRLSANLQARSYMLLAGVDLAPVCGAHPSQAVPRGDGHHEGGGRHSVSESGTFLARLHVAAW